LGLQISVLTARLIAAIGLTLSLSGSLALGILAHRSRQADEATQIRSKYGSLLITVRDMNWLERDSRVIEVSSIDDLAKIAERDGRMILHNVQGSLDARAPARVCRHSKCPSDTTSVYGGQGGLQPAAARTEC